MAVCEDYSKRNPNTVKLLSGEANLGIVGNFARTVKACTGDYLAILAGDDYWCDEGKLQKQLDYMAAHPEFGVVCTDGYRLMVKTGKLVPGLPPQEPAPDGDVRDFYRNRYGGLYAMPLTLLIRRDLIQYVDFDEFIRLRFPVEDYPMQSVLAHHTRFGYLPYKTVVYRVYKESATHISYDHPRYMAYHEGLANIRRYLNGLYPEDVPFTEEWAQEYVFYKSFLSHLHQGQFDEARLLVYRSPTSIKFSKKYRKARLAASSKIAFHLFKWYKRV